jgi:predicted RNA-binding Zn ribbon-like protein
VTGVRLGDELVLDFVGTLRSRRAEPEERLFSPESLNAWFAEAGLRPQWQPTRDHLLASIALREAIYSLALARMRGEAFPPESLAVVNRWAAQPPVTRLLTTIGVDVVSTPDSTLSSVARAAIDLLASFDAKIKECGREGCTRLFVDRSHGHRRVWCGMAECGDRVKAASYRARRRQAAADMVTVNRT